MIGTYYRLSLADEDVGADKAESNSIQGQRGLVEGYIMARPELATELREYVDDGYSGTSTSRPAFQRLIQDAQDGKVKTIIVKDFSRFARDYIEAGDYMERIFPLLGVRFISVNDGYDSGMQAGNDVRGLEVAIKNIILQPGSFCQNRGSRPCDAEKRNVSRRIPSIWIPVGPERLS